MKYGIFLPNGSNGYILSGSTSLYEPTFEHNKQISVEAEELGFDMVLSMMKYRGFGGRTGYWDSCLETFTLMAGLAAVTRKISLFPSVTLLAHHPAVVARMVATIDDISGGRCGLNVVTGWNKPEYTQMGLWPDDSYYARRYELAKEYVSILRQLWADGRCTTQTEHYTLEDCACYPVPRHQPMVVAAGQSPAGMQFVAEVGDRNFVMASGETLKQKVADLKGTARDLGREVGTFACIQIVAEATDEEAEAHTRKIIEDADLGAITAVMASATLDTNPAGTSEQLKNALNRDPADGNAAFMGMPVIRGSYQRVAEQLDRVAEETGIDGVMLCFPDYLKGIRDFGDRIMPHLSSASL
ncbi:LLM class flavin-dependent oxidoreductase [Celeribacter indicus]|nr:LLM class flavin-dependent oxidoreductase [Celeribacter indicus]SDX54183.1 pyrimidine oxygenase [Celeribacter indicus]